MFPVLLIKWSRRFKLPGFESSLLSDPRLVENQLLTSYDVTDRYLWCSWLSLHMRVCYNNTCWHACVGCVLIQVCPPCVMVYCSPIYICRFSPLSFNLLHDLISWSSELIPLTPHHHHHLPPFSGLSTLTHAQGWDEDFLSGLGQQEIQHPFLAYVS